MLLTLLIAPAILTGQGRPPVDTVSWAASTPIALLEARRSKCAILAVVTVGNRGQGLAMAIAGPEVNRVAQHFRMITADADEVRQLTRLKSAPTIPQYVFFDGSGTVLKRLSGWLRSADVAHAMAAVRQSQATTPPPKTPEEHARRALVLAMRGDLDGARQILAGPARRASRQALAEVHGAIGDELRARVENAAATPALERAVALSASPAQAVRWKVRLALNQMRMGNREGGIRQLDEAARTPGIRSFEVMEITNIADRFRSFMNSR